MTTNGAWVNGVFYDGIALTAADLNANNQWVLTQAASTVLLNQPNTWLAAQTYDGTLVTESQTFATLPASPVDGQRSFIHNSNTATFGAVAAGGGSNRVPVFYDGAAAAWKVG